MILFSRMPGSFSSLAPRLWNTVSLTDQKQFDLSEELPGRALLNLSASFLIPRWGGEWRGLSLGASAEMKIGGVLQNESTENQYYHRQILL